MVLEEVFTTALQTRLYKNLQGGVTLKGLKYIMQLEGCSSAELAERLNVSQPLISLWLKGSRAIPNKRLNDLALVFPKYPVYYFERELSNDDMKKLRNIKTSGATNKPDSRMSRVQNVINEQLNEQAKVLGDVASILNVAEFKKTLDTAKTLSDKDLIMFLFAIVGADQRLYIHDYEILNKLERMRKESPGDCRMPLISIALSALAEVFGYNDDISELAIPKSLRESISVDLERDPNVRLYSEYRNMIMAVFREIIGAFEERQRIIDEKNEMLRRKNEAD